jgi:AmmeMemoRadiSam system protein B
LKIRKPYVANAFYAGTKTELTKQIVSCFTHRFGPGQVPKVVERGGPRKILGLVSPHAGYAYSGPVAANGYSHLAADGIPEVFVILGPNHTGYGSGVSILTDGAWETPVGITSVDSGLAKQIQKASNILDIDEASHSSEHSIEVQLPFIQFLFKDGPKFIPICMMMQDLQTSRDMAKSIVEQCKGKNFIIIASSDFTHYETQDSAVRKDKMAIDAITNLDDATLNALGDTNRVTMCGYGPITTLIAAAKMLGGIKAELLAYKTSGDITGDKSSVVGYSSILFSRE